MVHFPKLHKQSQLYYPILVSKSKGACYTLQSPKQIGSARKKRRVFFGIAVIVVKFWVTAIKKKQCLIISQNDVTLRIVSTPFIVKYKAGRKKKQNKKPGANNSGLGVRNSEAEFWLQYFVLQTSGGKRDHKNLSEPPVPHLIILNTRLSHRVVMKAISKLSSAIQKHYYNAISMYHHCICTLTEPWKTCKTKHKYWFYVP